MADQQATKSWKDYKNNTDPSWWRDPGLRRNVYQCVGLYFCVFYLGYDASLLNGLQPMPQWKAYFDNPNSSYLGLISASLFLPAIITPYFSQYISDRFGRKTSLAVGSVLLIIGAFVNAFATNAGMFIGGRVLVGAAGPFGKITAIALLQEIAHPRLRPILATCYYSNYYFGSIAAAWFCFGSLRWGSTDWSWRAPCLFQIGAPLFVLVHLLVVPESPRWLVHHDRSDEALRILSRWHANGDEDDPLVRYELQEIQNAIQLEEENKKTKFTDFLKTPGNRRRLLVLITMATGTNWVGNGIITYYLSPVLNLVGIRDPVQVSAINGGLSVWNLVAAYTASLFAEKAGRRFLWLASTSGMLASYIVITGLSGSFANTRDQSVGIGTIPMLFIFYGFYCIGWTPLPYHMRLKGLSIMLSVQSIAQAFNQWVNPVALAEIQWKYYIVYVVLLVGYLILVFFFFPETRRMTIEEVSVIFDTGRLGNMNAVARELQMEHKSIEHDGVLDEKDRVSLREVAKR
ncbi:High-affinity glucose transporter [Elsinoe australis]|uniref:High-affinity glucose transporter n=1 Tax=Elsinoe australis TaxID=40998 RepID=A0A2P7YN32_9PEZI|nr:High-affinity glucose transporter [Elsinoe australis]